MAEPTEATGEKRATRRRRRSHGDGAVYFDDTGKRWVGVVELGRRPDGKRDRRKVTARTKSEALAKIRRLRDEIKAGAVGSPNMTLDTWTDYWLKKVAGERARAQSPNTAENWRWALSKVLPALGHKRLSSLTVEDVEGVLAANVHLSQNSVRRIRLVLADVLHTAEGRGHVTRNVARLAVLPQAKAPAERRALTPAEARSVRDAARVERLEALVVAGLTLGLRPGELAGLSWEDVNLDRATLSVTRSLKREPSTYSEHEPSAPVLRIGAVKRSSAGLRTLAMPAELTAALRLHKTRQAAERLTLGPAWEDNNLVFASEIGTPLDPANVRRVLARVSKRAGVKGVFPYLLRHAAASLLVDAGKSLEEVADLLGDRPETLLRHYRHRVRPVADAAVGPMDAIFAAASKAAVS